jgi:hypothetical protein
MEATVNNKIERTNNLRFILDERINNALNISEEALNGLRAYMKELSDDAVNQIYDDLHEAYQDKMSKHQE